MWQLVDIAYVVPVTVVMGVFLGNFLDDKYGPGYSTYTVLAFTFLGFVLAIIKVKRYIDRTHGKKEDKNA